MFIQRLPAKETSLTPFFAARSTLPTPTLQLLPSFSWKQIKIIQISIHHQRYCWLPFLWATPDRNVPFSHIRQAYPIALTSMLLRLCTSSTLPSTQTWGTRSEVRNERPPKILVSDGNRIICMPPLSSRSDTLKTNPSSGISIFQGQSERGLEKPRKLPV